MYRTNKPSYANRKPHLLFVVNADWFFLSHYLPIAKAARDAGAFVTAVTGDTGKSQDIRSQGIDYIRLPISRRSLNPLLEARTVAFLMRLYRRIRPDLVHHVTIKPVIYGSLAARTLRRGAVVNTVSGRGYLFSAGSRRRFFQILVNFLYGVALAHPRSRTVFQNQHDRDEFVRGGLVRNEWTELIPGSGVDCSVFRPTPEPQGTPVIMLPSRMLWDKGVKEYVEAARLSREEGCQARFVLLGDTDTGNPAAIPTEQLEAWAGEADVEWWGHSDDMPSSLSQANVVVLPSYREGVPKVLLEASASGRAIVATDIPGCREVVTEQQNGLLVAPHDSADLARAIRHLIDRPDLRESFGRAGREVALSKFSQEIVVKKTLAIYSRALDGEWPTTKFLED